MLEIWGRPYSSNVIPVIWTANELGLDYTLQLAGGSFGKLGTEEYAKINPNRMIPSIRDGDFTLWESHAIVRYLCDRYAKGTLCPEDSQARALADQWMEWSGTRAFPPVIQLFFATVRTAPERRDPAKIESLRDEASEILALFDAYLAGRAYVTGDTFTMGDIPLGCVAYRFFNVDVERPSLPNLEAWYTRLCERPAYQKHVMRFFGANPDQWAALEEACASEGVL
ncbi:MAG: glutathione S-transferase [Anderseniella sp.]